MSAISSALAGMHQAEASIDTTASRLARQPFTADKTRTSTPTDTVELSAEMVSLMQARNNFAASVKVVKASDSLERSTLSILA